MSKIKGNPENGAWHPVNNEELLVAVTTICQREFTDSGLVKG